MRSILVIGIGRFGEYLTKHFSSLGHEVMIIDKEEENIKKALPYARNAQIADCTEPEVLKNVGVRNFDVCFVCIGVDFQSSLEITCMLKELGAKEVISKASDNIHAKFLLKNGADRVVYPEKDMAIRIAERYAAENALDYVGIGGDVGMYEIPVQKHWAGKTVREISFRAKYGVNIIAVRTNGKLELMNDADYEFNVKDSLLIVGHREDLQKFLKKID